MSFKGDLFVNHINKVINNNEKAYYSNKDDIEINNIDTNKNVLEKINDIFTSRNFIYKADVIIKTKEKEISKRIVGRNSNYLITNENELIPITDIIDIKRQ